MHNVKSYLNAAVIWAIVMVISFAICVKRRLKDIDDPTEMPRKGRIAANGSGPGKTSVAKGKPAAAKEEKTALPPPTKPKVEKTLPRSEYPQTSPAVMTIATTDELHLAAIDGPVQTARTRSLAPPPEERPKTPGKCVEQDPGSSLKSWNLIKDEHVSFE